MPTKLKLVNKAAEPLKWNAAFKQELAEAGDPRFFTQQIFRKWWDKGLDELFLSKEGATLELTIDADKKEFTWQIKAAKGPAFFAAHTDLKAVAIHKGKISGAPGGSAPEDSATAQPPAPQPPEPKKEAPVTPTASSTKAKEEEEESGESDAEDADAAAALKADYDKIYASIKKAALEADDEAKKNLKLVLDKVKEKQAKKAPAEPLEKIVDDALFKINAALEKRKLDPAHPFHKIVPPSGDELAKQREIDEAKFRKSQREAQKAAEKRKLEASGTAETAEEETEEVDRWIPGTGDLPLWGQLNGDQKASVQSKLEDYNSRGRGGHSHRGVGGVLTLDLTGPAWGSSGRGDWRLQIDSKNQSLNIVNHQNKTWKP